MGFFDNISKKTTETTSKIAREAKLKMKINENKGRINKLYETIGKTVYEDYIREENINIKELIKNDCLNIDKLSKEIDEARKEILILNNKKMCKKCYAEIESDDMFCPKCGQKQTDEKTTFEKAEEKIKSGEISSEKVEEGEIIKEELEKKNNND